MPLGEAELITPSSSSLTPLQSLLTYAFVLLHCRAQHEAQTETQARIQLLLQQSRERLQNTHHTTAPNAQPSEVPSSKRLLPGPAATHQPQVLPNSMIMIRPLLQAAAAYRELHAPPTLVPFLSAAVDRAVPSSHTQLLSLGGSSGGTQQPEYHASTASQFAAAQRRPQPQEEQEKQDAPAAAVAEALARARALQAAQKRA